MTKINTGNANESTKTVYFVLSLVQKRTKLIYYPLCNAVSGTDCTDVDDIEITTLSNAIYIKMKNDISFLIDSQMNLFGTSKYF